MKHIYKNGNSTITIDDTDGSREIYTPDDEFRFDFPLNADVTISHKCDNCCEFCYLGCSPEGEFGDILGAKFVDTLHPYTELAFNLNFPVHPDLIQWLDKIKQRKVFANATINQNHFMENTDFIRGLVDAGYLHGIGISLTNPTTEFVDKVKAFPTAVIHVINGIFSSDDYAMLKDNDLKILILGYKDFGRGTEYHKLHEQKIGYNQDFLFLYLDRIMSHFKVVSFDNLAVEQLKMKQRLPGKVWDEFYHGNDGTSTLGIDLVTGRFGRNSMSTVTYPIKDTMEEMFEKIRV
jgi:hypothetical protein